MVGGAKCTTCNGKGYIFSESEDYVDEIQRCDECNVFISDEDARDNAQFTMHEKSFLDWYFSDFDEVKDLGYKAMFKLRSDGMFTIITQDLLDICNEIPTYLVVEADGYDYDFRISNKQITLIK
jgi:hypothetical protein